jgi:hypothetical protein|tara:strand:+ start:192 stop:431 length:240 start_codon:yes stop_codon:yes gene_type:complete
MTTLPKKKPYTKKKFLEQTELYLKGMKGGFDKVEMHNKIVTKGNILRKQGVSRNEVISIIKKANQNVNRLFRQRAMRKD